MEEERHATSYSRQDCHIDGLYHIILKLSYMNEMRKYQLQLLNLGGRSLTTRVGFRCMHMVSVLYHNWLPHIQIEC